MQSPLIVCVCVPPSITRVTVVFVHVTEMGTSDTETIKTLTDITAPDCAHDVCCFYPHQHNSLGVKIHSANRSCLVVSPFGVFGISSSEFISPHHH